jgi:Cellulase (glycosyl hydrolase family 5)/Family of unknown function (DUF6298)
MSHRLFGARGLLACAEVILPMILSGAVLAAQSGSPILRHPDNPNYFLFRGQPTALVGASYIGYAWWANTAADYVQWLDVSQHHGLNVFRIWNRFRGYAKAGPASAFIYPWARSSTPGAADGLNKFDLDRWNDAYFTRLKDFVSKASDRGIVVEVVQFSQMYDTTNWGYCSLNASNNIQGIGTLGWQDFITLRDSALAARQAALVQKVVQELNSFDNVYYEICNEPNYTGEDASNANTQATLDWHNFLIQKIIDTELELPNKHMIAVNYSNPYSLARVHPGVSVVNTHYTYGSFWTGAYELLDGCYDSLNRPLGFNEAGWLGGGSDYDPADGRVEAWEFLMGGGSVYDGLIGGMYFGDVWNTPEANQYRSYLEKARQFLYSFEFSRMKKDTSVVVSGGSSGNRRVRAVSEPGRQYAVYTHYSSRTGGNDAFYSVAPGTYCQGLTLNLPAGSYAAEWVDPRTGTITRSESFTHGGGNIPIASPAYSVDIALRIKTSPAVSPPNAPSGLNGNRDLVEPDQPFLER